MKFPSNLLEGKTILISGSGSGIGRQIAKTFSEFGADLILLSKNLEKLETLFKTDPFKDIESRHEGNPDISKNNQK